MVSADILKLFPYQHIREGQQELISDLQTAFRERKILIAQAPTGLGKTASVLTVALTEALAHRKKIFFLTNRHTQHKIAIDTLRKIREKTNQNIFCVDLIGKRWMCNQEIAGVFGSDFNEFCRAIVERGECEFYNRARDKNGLTVEGKALLQKLQHSGPLHNEELVIASKEKSLCSYEMALALAKNAQVLIGDYNYLFNPFVQASLLAKLELKMEDIILIVDEGHNLPSRIMDMLSNSLTTNMLMNAVTEARKFSYQGVLSWLQSLNQILQELAGFKEINRQREMLIQKQDFISKVEMRVDYEELIDQLEVSAEEIRKKQNRSYLGGIAAFLQAWKGEDIGYTRILSEQGGKQGSFLLLTYSCLDPRIITKNIFSQIYCGALMSGTLKPTFMYKEILGIERGWEKEYSSPFPPENKLNLIVPETSTKYTLRDEAMYRLLAKKCSEMTQLIPGNVALFFPSYDLRDRISYFIISDKKLFFEKSELSKADKENLLQQFKAARVRGGLLLGVAGANFAEGIDLPGDLLNGVIIVGLPLARPDLQTKELIKFYDLKFGRGWDYGYIYPAMSKCFQSAGRCIRSETDKGAVIYLDERFAWKNYYDCFSKEGLIVTRDYGKLLREFFK